MCTPDPLFTLRIWGHPTLASTRPSSWQMSSLHKGPKPGVALLVLRGIGAEEFTFEEKRGP